MTEGDSHGENSPSTSRRSVLKKLGLATGAVMTGPFVGTATADKGTGPDEFAVSGTEHGEVRYEPDRITVHETKRAPELRERYGVGVIENTETRERPAPENDGYPMRDTVTYKQPWETHVATEDEWTEKYKEAADDVSTQHHAQEFDYPYAVWQFKKNDDGYYERNSPINLISPETISDIDHVLYYSCSWYTSGIAQYDRYAYNNEVYEFQEQHDASATSRFGTLGRNHVRMWEFNGYVSIQGHIDSSVPHKATSYLDSEREVEECFDDWGGWYGYKDYYDVPNCCPKDHNGYATGLFDY